MRKTIAERKLFYSLKGSNDLKEFIIRIEEPYPVDADMVGFSIGDGVIGCHVEIDGLAEEYTEKSYEVYGTDELQAINIASNVEPYLNRLSKKYNLYWSSGDPYFE